MLALHGGMPQLKRVAAYNQFIWKQNAVLFATDIAARGLGMVSDLNRLINISHWFKDQWILTTFLINTCQIAMGIC